MSKSRYRASGISVLALVVLSACLNSSNDDDSSGPITESGLYTLTSSGLEREYYVRRPTNYVPGEEARPLLIALHGAGDSIDGWFAGGFQGDGLLQLSADEAIMIIPNARPAAEGRRIWDPGTETDYDFFLDLLSELDQRLTYDGRRIFVTAQSRE